MRYSLICLHKAGHKHYYYQPVHTYVLNPKVGWGKKGEGGREEGRKEGRYSNEGGEGEREKVEKVYYNNRV